MTTSRDGTVGDERLDDEATRRARLIADIEEIAARLVWMRGRPARVTLRRTAPSDWASSSGWTARVSLTPAPPLVAQGPTGIAALRLLEIAAHDRRRRAHRG